MRVTLETVNGTDLIYIYLKDEPLPSGTRITTKTGLQADLLFTPMDNWGGIFVFANQDFSGTAVRFNTDVMLNRSQSISCNVDMLDSEVYGVELMLKSGSLRSTALIADILEIRTANG